MPRFSNASTRVGSIALIALLAWALCPGNEAAAQDFGEIRQAELATPRPHVEWPPPELGRGTDHRDSLRRLIGSRRSQKLWEARYLIDRYERDQTTSIYDWQDDYNEARRALEKAASKAITELAVQRLGLDTAGERLRSRRKERLGMSLSPRAKLGSDPGLGVKLRLRCNDAIWSRLFLEVNQRFESNELETRLVWRNHDYSFELSHALDDRQSLRHHGPHHGRGDRVTKLYLRLAF